MKTSGLERHFWNQYAKSYDNLAKHYEPYISLVHEVCQHIDHYAKGRSIRILDAGCGTGNYVLELTKRGHEVVGIDSSEFMLSRAKHKISSHTSNLPPKIMPHDMNELLPFENHSFDAVISVHVLYTLADHSRFVQELRRVAHQSSIVVIVNSYAHLTIRGAIGKQISMTKGFKRLRSLISLLSVGFWNAIFTLRQHDNYQITTDDELRDLLTAAGATDIEIHETYVGSILAIGYWH